MKCLQNEEEEVKEKSTSQIGSDLPSSQLQSLIGSDLA